MCVEGCAGVCVRVCVCRTTTKTMRHVFRTMKPKPLWFLGLWHRFWLTFIVIRVAVTPPPPLSTPNSPLDSCAVPVPFPFPPCLPLRSRLSKRTKFSLQPSQTLVHINCLLSRPRGGAEREWGERDRA